MVVWVDYGGGALRPERVAPTPGMASPLSSIGAAGSMARGGPFGQSVCSSSASAGLLCRSASLRLGHLSVAGVWVAVQAGRFARR